MKSREEFLNEEKKKVIKSLKIKSSMFTYVLTGGLVLTAAKGVNSYFFIQNYDKDTTPTKDVVAEVVLDVIPLSVVTTSVVKKLQYKKDIKTLQRKIG